MDGLRRYRSSVEYSPGLTMAVPDALSRQFEDDSQENVRDQQMIERIEKANKTRCNSKR